MISQFKVSDPTPIPSALAVPRAFPEKSRAVDVKAMDPAVLCYCRTKRWLDGRCSKRHAHAVAIPVNIGSVSLIVSDIAL